MPSLPGEAVRFASPDRLISSRMLKWRFGRWLKFADDSLSLAGLLLLFRFLVVLLLVDGRNEFQDRAVDAVALVGRRVETFPFEHVS